jgi:hypothetical protein
MKNVVIVCLFLCLGCSPATRLARLEKKHPELFKNIQDTIIQFDTFTKYDTSEYEIWIDSFTQFDTVNNQTVLRIRTKITNRIFITKRINQTLRINTTKYIKEQPQPKQNWKLWAYIAVIITIFVIIWKIFK